MYYMVAPDNLFRPDRLCDRNHPKKTQMAESTAVFYLLVLLCILHSSACADLLPKVIFRLWPDGLIEEGKTPFYNVSFVKQSESVGFRWSEIKNANPNTINNQVYTSTGLTTIPLGFNFIFYDHYLKNVTISINGFLFLSDLLNNSQELSSKCFLLNSTIQFYLKF